MTPRLSQIASGQAHPVFDALVRRQMGQLGTGAAQLAARVPGGQGAGLAQRAIGSLDPMEALSAGLGEQMEAKRIGAILQAMEEQKKLDEAKRRGRYIGAGLTAAGAILGTIASAGNPAGGAAGAAGGGALSSTITRL